MQVKWGIEDQADFFSMYIENINGDDCLLDLRVAGSLQSFLEGKSPRHCRSAVAVQLCLEWDERRLQMNRVTCGSGADI